MFIDTFLVAQLMLDLRDLMKALANKFYVYT